MLRSKTRAWTGTDIRQPCNRASETCLKVQVLELIVGEITAGTGGSDTCWFSAGFVHL